MRLIDADDVKDLINGLDSLPWEEECGELVDALPTAYDIDKVVEQLEELSKYEVVEKKFEKAIEIVKKGGAV